MPASNQPLWIAGKNKNLGYCDIPLICEILGKPWRFMRMVASGMVPNPPIRSGTPPHHAAILMAYVNPLGAVPYMRLFTTSPACMRLRSPPEQKVGLVDPFDKVLQ